MMKITFVGPRCVEDADDEDEEDDEEAKMRKKVDRTITTDLS
jgi:hypothetical protein